MEVEVLSVRGASEETVISVRAGACRRQASVGTLAAGTTFKIPVGPSGVNPFKVDLLRPLGSARLALRPEPGSYAAELKGAGEGGHDARVEFVLKDSNGPGSAQTSARSGPRAEHKEPKEFAGLFQTSAMAAKEYMETHQILTFVRALIQTLIRDQPDDPFGFIADQFRWASNEGDAKAAMRSLDEMSATPGDGGTCTSEPQKSPTGSHEAKAECKPAAKPKTPPPELAVEPKTPSPELAGGLERQGEGPADEAAGIVVAPLNAVDAAVDQLAQESAGGRVPEAMAAEVDNTARPFPVPSHHDDALVDMLAKEGARCPVSEAMAAEVDNQAPSSLIPSHDRASTVSPSDDTFKEASLPHAPVTGEAGEAEDAPAKSVPETEGQAQEVPHEVPLPHAPVTGEAAEAEDAPAKSEPETEGQAQEVPHEVPLPHVPVTGEAGEAEDAPAKSVPETEGQAQEVPHEVPLAHAPVTGEAGEAEDAPAKSVPETEGQAQGVPHEVSLPHAPVTGEAAEAEDAPAKSVPEPEEQAQDVQVGPEEVKRQEEMQTLRADYAALQNEVLELKKRLNKRARRSLPASAVLGEPAETEEQLRSPAKGTLFQACADGSLDSSSAKIEHQAAKAGGNGVGADEHLRAMAKLSLFQACADGSLDSSLANAKPQAAKAGGDEADTDEQMRLMAKASLFQACENGTLDASLTRVKTRRRGFEADGEGADTDEEMRLMAKASLFQACENGTLDASLTRVKTKRLDDQVDEDPAPEVKRAKSMNGGEIQAAKGKALAGLLGMLRGREEDLAEDGEMEGHVDEARDFPPGGTPELSPEEDAEARAVAIEALDATLSGRLPHLDGEEEEGAKAAAQEALDVGLLGAMPELTEAEANEAREMALEALGTTILGDPPTLTGDEEEVARLAAIEALDVEVLCAPPTLSQAELELAREEASKALSSLFLGEWRSGKPPEEEQRSPEEAHDLSPIKIRRLKETGAQALHDALLGFGIPEPEGEAAPKAVPLHARQRSSSDLSNLPRPATTGSIKPATIRTASRSAERALDYHSGQLQAITHLMEENNSHADHGLARAFAESHSYHITRAKHVVRSAMHELGATEGKVTDFGEASTVVPTDTGRTMPTVATADHPLMTATLAPPAQWEKRSRNARGSSDASGEGVEEMDVEPAKARARQALRNALAEESGDSLEDAGEAAKLPARGALGKASGSAGGGEGGELHVDLEAARAKARGALQNVLSSEGSAKAKEATPRAQVVAHMTNKALLAAFRDIDLPPEHVARAMKAAEAAIQKEVAKAQAPGPSAEGRPMSPGEVEEARLKALSALQHALRQRPRAVQATLRSAAAQETGTGVAREKAGQASEAAMREGASETDPSLLGDEPAKVARARASARKALGGFLSTG